MREGKGCRHDPVNVRFTPESGSRRARLKAAPRANPLASAARLDAVEISAAGNEHAFDADAVGILEQHGIISRRPGAAFRRAHDLGAEIGHRGMQRIDVLPRAQAEAEMMEADAPLVEMRYLDR